jgi:hypothetical protein
VSSDREGRASSHKLADHPDSRGTPRFPRFQMAIIGTYPKTCQDDDKFPLDSLIHFIFLVTELQVCPGLPALCKSLKVDD